MCRYKRGWGPALALSAVSNLKRKSVLNSSKNTSGVARVARSEALVGLVVILTATLLHGSTDLLAGLDGRYAELQQRRAGNLSDSQTLVLDCVQRQQVVHRDLHSDSIRFEAATGAIDVTDFGIARTADVSGTPTGLPLGKTPFQLLTGTLPLPGNSMAALTHQGAHQIAPDVACLCLDLPDTRIDILQKALCEIATGSIPVGRGVGANAATDDGRGAVIWQHQSADHESKRAFG